MKALKRSIDGIFLLDKPKNISSNHALQKIKRLFQAKKAGHTGSLDPLATGMLPICFGYATKFSQYLLDATKTYEVVAQLGVRTDTADAEGSVISSRPITHQFNEVELALEQFRGAIQQVPPMYSALKHQGKPLYQLARAGKSIERPPRPVTIYHLELLNHQSDLLSLRVVCSKGTYIRSLVDDLGERLRCGAHVVELRRTNVSAFLQHQMISFPALESVMVNDSYDQLDQLLLPIEAIFQERPAIEVTPDMVMQLRNKTTMDAPSNMPEGLIRFVTADKEFVGIGKIAEDQKLYPLRLIHHLLD